MYPVSFVNFELLILFMFTHARVQNPVYQAYPGCALIWILKPRLQEFICG